MSSMQGSYPGGPKRSAGDSERIGEERRPGRARLERAEDVEARTTAVRKKVGRSRRTKRVVVGLVAAVVLAGGIGLYLGYRAHKTSEAITAERNDAAAGIPGKFDPTFQTNRILDELWKMEIKQRQPSAP